MLARAASRPLWVSRYYGIPFIDRGLTRDGCDCWGLVRLVIMEQTGVRLPEYPEIGRGATLSKLRAILAAADGPEWLEVDPGQEKAFDVVLMRGLVEHDDRKHQRPIHIGCVVTPGTLIHIEDGCEVTVVDYRSHPRMKHRLTGFYRHWKLA
jgi:hypothetical protein